MNRLSPVTALVASAVATTRRRRAHGPRIPAWSWGFEVVVGMLKRTSARLAPLPWAEQRAGWELLSQPSPILRRVRREDVSLGAVPCVRVTPRGAPRGTLVYLHGGSYLYGSPETHAELIARLALAANVVVIAPRYRLAPEHPLPAAIEDAVSVCRAVEGGYVLAGDSAGGGLALTTAVALRDAGAAMPVALAPLSPWVDLSAKGGTLLRHSEFDWAEPWMFERWAEAARGVLALDDPRCSPRFADLRGLPPTRVLLGGAEMLVDQVRAFVEVARMQGVDITFSEYPDMVHNWVTLTGLFPACGRGIEEVGTFVRTALDG